MASPSSPRPPRNRQPKTQSVENRLVELTQREKALAIRATARKRVTLDITLDDYEALVVEAERTGERVPTVLRACLKAGLDHITRFPTGPAPYARGDLRPRPQNRLDPTGTAWPPTAVPLGITNNAPVEPPAPVAFIRPIPKPGMLPSGATIDTSPPATLTPPDDAHQDDNFLEEG